MRKASKRAEEAFEQICHIQMPKEICEMVTVFVEAVVPAACP